MTEPTIENVKCMHRLYSVDTREQTGKCYGCGATGKMRFIVDDAELAAMKNQPVPVEPKRVSDLIKSIMPEYKADLVGYIDALQSALQAAQQERNGFENELARIANGTACCEYGNYLQSKQQVAEARNKRLVELLREAHDKIFLCSGSCGKGILLKIDELLREVDNGH